MEEINKRHTGEVFKRITEGIPYSMIKEIQQTKNSESNSE